MLDVLVRLLHVTDESVDRANTESAYSYRRKAVLGKFKFPMSINVPDLENTKTVKLVN